MATSKAFIEVEDWVRRTWMLETFGQRFNRERLRLRSGGVFDFDAVSSDERVIGVISGSSGRAKNGREAKPKMNKIRSDILFLLLADADRRLVIFADEPLYAMAAKEKQEGRLPSEVELHYAPLPTELRAKLSAAQKAASIEITGEEESA